MILRKRVIVLLLLCISVTVQAGTLPSKGVKPSGVQFEYFPNWNATIAKAQRENKLILVDCYASWCKPCKAMDAQVYSLDSVGEFVNSHYISIKVQFDSTADDNDQVKNWYGDARHLEKEYGIQDYPTFLFFTPEGKLVHKSIGYKDPARFMRITRNTLNPEFQYYTLLETYRQGKMTFEKMPFLSSLAESVNDKAIANEVSQHYINDYLLKQKDSKLFDSTNLQYIAGHVQSSNDKAFKLFFKDGRKIDDVIKAKDFSRNLIDRIVVREEIDSRLYADRQALKENKINPDWEEIHQQIKKKFDGECADRVTLYAKIGWSEYKHDWPAYCKNLILRVEKYGPYNNLHPFRYISDADSYNGAAWEIFLRSQDSVQLKKALEWSNKSITGNAKPGAQSLDTYANLLYKLGKTAEAIEFEEKAIAAGDFAFRIQEYKETIVKFKNNEPTWPTK